MGHGDSVDQMLEAGVVRAAILLVLEIDVVHDLGDGAQRRIGELEVREQDLERTELALVRELAVEHVEAQLARLVAIVARRDELELRLRIDEAPDEPRARHPIAVDAGACHPDRSARLLGGPRESGFGFFLALAELFFHVLHEPLYARAAPRLAEVDTRHLAP